jgi:G:T/U-mismatch repair DNA glycosylase
MLLHNHPYRPFIPPNTTKLIVGTLPPPRFSSSDLFECDVDFCYGSKYGLLWPILDKIFELDLKYKNSKFAVDQRKEFLKFHHIGICDMIESCEREKNNASDLGMKNIKLRDLTQYLIDNPSIDTILLMGGNSKNGPEYLFRKHLKVSRIQLNQISKKSPKIHQFYLNNRTIRTVSLISPSNAANRAIGADPTYKKQKKVDNTFTTFDYRVHIYKKYFKQHEDHL